MASTSSGASPPSCSGHSWENEFIDQLLKHPELRGPNVRPTRRVHVPEPLAIMKTRVRRKDPIEHQKILERLYFPGCYIQSTPSKKTEKPHRRREQLPVRLPARESTTKLSENVMTSPWEEGRSQLIRFPTFALFKMWKPFYIWRTKVHSKKFHVARESLQNHLFIVSRSLGSALVDIRKMCCQISDTGLCHMEEKRTYTLQEFRDVQFKQLQEVLTDLEKFQDLVKQVTVCACRNYLSEQSKSDMPDDHERWSIVAQIIKVVHSNRLMCFIRLINYLVANTLHNLVVSAVAKLLAVLQERVCQTPSHAIIQSWSQQIEGPTDPAEEDVQKKPETLRVQPLFITELMLDGDALTYRPSEDNFKETIEEIIGQFEKKVMSVKIISADPDIDFMTEPGLNKTLENKYEDGPCLESILSNDGHLQSLIQNIKESIQSAFDSARVYLHMFERFRLFYKENRSLDPDAMRQQDHGVSFFEEALRLYRSEHEEALAIQQKSRLGLLLVDKTQLKEKLVSSPLRCLEVINEMLPQLAKRKVDAVVAEACEAEFKLKFRPSTTTELANSLTFLGDIQERVMVLEEEQEAVCQMYSLVNMYSLPMPPEDLVVFTTMQPYISSLQNSIAEAELQRDFVMDKFCKSLHKDMKELSCDIMKTKLKLLDPQILDINADFSQVRPVLRAIQISIDELQARASTYTSFQKKLKVEVTEYDNLEELCALFRLTQLLWDFLEEWDSLQDGWRQSTLEQLDLEQLSLQVIKYCQYINQLEKGLPRNNIVPSLKNKVEVMKQRLPVITNLCNPCMKPKHWRTLASVVGASLNVEELTLAVLEEINIFSFDTEIQEVSGQASGEASVETIITKWCLSKGLRALGNVEDWHCNVEEAMFSSPGHLRCRCRLRGEVERGMRTSNADIHT